MARFLTTFLLATLLALVSVPSIKAETIDLTEYFNPQHSSVNTVDNYLQRGPQLELAESADKSLPAELQQAWMGVVEAIDNGSLSDVNTRLQELELIKARAGFWGLDDYALYLGQKGEQYLNKGDIDSAAFYADRALKLSPTSPKVALATLTLADETGTVSSWEQLVRLVGWIPDYPELFFSIFVKSAYPVLWALSIGVYITCFLLFVSRMEELNRWVGVKLPRTMRGFLAPVVVLAAIILPLFFGPFWCLAVWGLFIFAALRQYRWVTFLAGITLFLWGSVIPLKENAALWLKDPRIQSMLSISAGEFSPFHRENLIKLSHERSEDGVLTYTYGQLMRKIGDYKKAEEAFAGAEMLFGNTPWIVAQKGMISYMQGDIRKADKLFAEAEAEGLDSAAFYYNFSRIKFELLDTVASREYFQKADRIDHVFVETLSSREKLLGNDARTILADINLPVSKLFGSALLPIAGAKQKYAELAGVLMQGMQPKGIALIGFLLVLCFLFGKEKHAGRRVKYHIMYNKFKPSWVVERLVKAFPGGIWVWGGKPAIGAIVLSIFTIFIMPLAGWPYAASELVSAWPNLWAFYGSVAFGIWVISYWLGSIVLGEE